MADSEQLFIERYCYDLDSRFLPSEGVLFSEGDRALIKMHEQRMMEFLSAGLKDEEMMCRFLLKNMLKGRGLVQQDSHMLWAGVKKAKELGMDLGSSVEMDFRGTAPRSGLQTMLLQCPTGHPLLCGLPQSTRIPCHGNHPPPPLPPPKHTSPLPPSGHLTAVQSHVLVDSGTRRMGLRGRRRGVCVCVCVCG